MAEEENTVSMAKKYILRDMGVPDADIDNLRSNEEADGVIDYITKKNAAVETKDEKEENPKDKIHSFKGNVGHPLAELPDREKLNSKYKLSLVEALNPLAPKRSTNNRWNQSARILVHFDEDNPNGRVF